MKKILIAIIAIVVVASIATYLAQEQGYMVVDNGGENYACTKELKICPDGTYVGRTGPNCEFVCPGPNQGNEQTLTNPGAYFSQEMNAIAVARVGQAIEGFTPAMYMQAFPGLTASDFEGVQAEQGIYTVVNGQPTFNFTASGPEHSAANAISSRGMDTLLSNITARLFQLATTQGEVDYIISLLD